MGLASIILFAAKADRQRSQQPEALPDMNVVQLFGDSDTLMTYSRLSVLLLSVQHKQHEGNSKALSSNCKTYL